MIRTLTVVALLVPAIAAAQSVPQHSVNSNKTVPHMVHQSAEGVSAPIQAGQAAFAAIQEIVSILEADPGTNWAKVNIEALRQHLVDMDNVTLGAVVTSEPVKNGMRYTVTGTGAVQDSIRRMVSAHAATMNGDDGWRFQAAVTGNGATLTVLAPARDIDKLHGLGFIGVMTRGMHHQEHHLMLARGMNPHE